MSDWRLQGQENFLYGKPLKKRKYQIHRDGWEHDHCEFCGAKFSLKGNDLKEGFSTIDNYHWICTTCFDDFKDKFNWKVEND
jgi:hypothetical protein